MKSLKTFSLLSILIITVSISVFAYVSTKSFMMADDYCYFSILNRSGFLESQINSYQNVVIYAGNRYSATLFSGIVGKIGSPAVPLFPLFTIVCFSLSLVFVLKQTYKYFKVDNQWTFNILATLFTVFILIYIAPTRFQNWYWFSGIIAYTFPFIFFLFSLGLLLFNLNQPKTTPLSLFVLFIITLLSVGFSETSAVAFFTTTILVILFLILIQRNKVTPSMISMLLAMIIGIVLLIISPSSQSRLASLSPGGVEQTFSPIKVLLMSLRYSFDFINNTISGYILLFVFSFLNFVCLSILYPINNYLQLTFQRKIVISFLVIAAVYLIIAASMAPTIFTFSAYPNQRSLFVPTFFLVIGVSLVSILFGSSIKINRKPFKLTVSILLIIVSFYTLRGSIKEFDTLNELKPRQTLWFERDQQVRSEVAAGKQLIQIKGIDSIETISDFNPVCLRLYYGIDEFILGE